VHELQETYEREIEELAATSVRMAELGYVTSHGGNLSSRVAEDVVLITPTQVCKRLITFDDVVILDMDGSVLYVAPGRKPTGESPFHLRILHQRPDAKAVVHAHPPVLTGFAIAHSDLLARPFLPEPVIEVGPVVAVDYAEPISEALARTFDEALPYANVFLMKNHGVTLCCAHGLARALELLEMLECMAQSVLAAESLGGARELSPEDVGDLERTMETRSLPLPGRPGVVKRLRDLFYPET
jgi:L-fuculose-phosphate aldolase